MHKLGNMGLHAQQCSHHAAATPWKAPGAAYESSQLRARNVGGRTQIESIVTPKAAADAYPGRQSGSRTDRADRSGKRVAAERVRGVPRLARKAAARSLAVVDAV